jgi:hypothetical protein
LLLHDRGINLSAIQSIRDHLSINTVCPQISSVSTVQCLLQISSSQPRSAQHEQPQPPLGANHRGPPVDSCSAPLQEDPAAKQGRAIQRTEFLARSDELLRLLRDTKGEMMWSAQNSNPLMTNGGDLMHIHHDRCCYIRSRRSIANGARHKEYRLRVSVHTSAPDETLLSPKIQPLHRLAMIKFY